MLQKEESSLEMVWLVLGGGVLCAGMIWAGLRWPELFTPGPSAPIVSPFSGTAAATQAPPATVPALVELLKLVLAALIGVVVTAVHKRCRRKKPLPASLTQAQILLSVSGALMMIIIGESLPRAFGIAGAAAIIRFRTPVKDPKDTTIMFLLMALGMSAGLGLFAVAGLATVFLCLFLLVLDYLTSERVKARAMMLELVASGNQFPTAQVHNVFAGSRVAFEPREVSHGKEVSAKYHVTLDPTTSLEDLSSRLMSVEAPGIKSVTWQKAKKKWTI